MSWLTALVIGRILAQDGFQPPRVEDHALLFIKRSHVTVGCTPGDAGVIGDAAVVLDGAVADAGAPGDASVGDAGLGDAGVPDASTCETIPGDAITMVVQPHVSTDESGTGFAVLYVTPKRPIVELAGDAVFASLDAATGRRTEIKKVYVEDSSLGTVCRPGTGGGGGCFDFTYHGGGGGCGPVNTEQPDTPDWEEPTVGDAGLGDGAIVSETIGPYQFVRAQPATTTELAGWLDQLGYHYMPADLDAVAPYIALGYHVVALRVALAKPMQAPMVPIALTWPGSEIRIAAALGHGALTSNVLTVYIAAETRYDLPDATLHYAGLTTSDDAPYVTRQEITLDQNLPASQDPTAAASSAFYPDFQEVDVINQEIRVPEKVDCDDDGCCDTSAARSRTRYDMLSIVAALAFVLRRPRRRRDR